MNALDLLGELLSVSQKAANLARAVRSEGALFSLLVEEKTGDSKNKRFVEDFKTLADVLVQEVVIHDLGKKFPGLIPNIKGEESSTFTNTLGETVTLQIQATEQDTTDLLARVLDGNQEAASLLARAVHTNVAHEPMPKLAPLGDVTLDQEALGIWIDPIDSTAQYIHGFASEKTTCGVYEQGLQCVVVLIGVYDLHTGLPVAGVINQPFSQLRPSSQQWDGRYCIGFNNGTHSLTFSSASEINPSTGDSLNTVLLSTSEIPAVLGALSEQFQLVYAAGAGYKVLCVIDDLVGTYVLSKASTFKWDTCSPHAILLALGGGAVDLQKVVGMAKSSSAMLDGGQWATLLAECQLHYNTPDSTELSGGEVWCNSGGVLVYRSQVQAIKVIERLAKC